MKKYVLSIFTCAIITTVGIAQNVTTVTQVPSANQMTKEEKEKLRLKQEEDLALAYKEAGITDDLVAQIKLAQQDARSKIKLVDDTLKTNFEAQVGKDMLKPMRDAQKKQRDEIAKIPPPIAPLSKEEKVALKTKQDEDLANALKNVGFTDAQVITAKLLDDNANKQKSEINKILQKKIIDIAGQENLKKFKEIQARQKAAAASPTSTPPIPATAK